jgi:hypothetical protein
MKNEAAVPKRKESRDDREVVIGVGFGKGRSVILRIKRNGRLESA